MNDTDELYEVALQLILDAGDARSMALMAIQAAREFRFSDAEDLIAKAENSMRAAHNTQTDAIQAEARGTQAPPNLIMVHAQDHMSMALVSMDFARESLHIYRMIHDLQNK